MTDETSNPVDEPNVEDGTKPDETLGEPGKKALDAERAARKAAEDEQKKLATKLKEIEDRDKTEAQKTAERLAEAEKRTLEVEARATRAEIAGETLVPVNILAGPKSASADDLREFAELVNTFVAEASLKKPSGPIVPSQGKHPESTSTENADDWFRALARK